MRFHLAYVPDGSIHPAGDVAVPSLGLFPDHLPDIDNINLKDILGLGFPLPMREAPERYKLYLKLFEFPEGFSRAHLCEAFFSAYRISDMPCADDFLQFTARPGNVAVKFGMIDDADRGFTPENPFPPLLVSDVSDFAVSFGRKIPFVSLYLTPDEPGVAATDEERAAASARGVLAFHKALLAHYSAVLERVEGEAPAQFYYFRDGATHTLIRLQKEPFLFANWRQLPMPTNPSQHFLSSLFLIFRTQTEDSSLAHETVFEVASVVRTASPAVEGATR